MHNSLNHLEKQTLQLSSLPFGHHRRNKGTKRLRKSHKDPAQSLDPGRGSELSVLLGPAGGRACTGRGLMQGQQGVALAARLIPGCPAPLSGMQGDVLCLN